MSYFNQEKSHTDDRVIMDIACLLNNKSYGGLLPLLVANLLYNTVSHDMTPPILENTF